MPPTIRTYQGKRPTKRLSRPRPTPTSDPFDQLVFGQRRSPHPFSSSNEDIPTPSPVPSIDEWPVFLSTKYHSTKGTLNSVKRNVLKKSKMRKTPYHSPAIMSAIEGLFQESKSSTQPKKAGKLLATDVRATSTPIRRVHRKRVKHAKAESSSCFHEEVTTPNLDKPEADLPLGSPNVSFILNSPLCKKFKVPVLETPKPVGIPPRNSIDSVTNKLLLMNLAGASAPRERSGSLRDDLLSSSEDENEDDGYGDISSRPSESYPFYEPSLLEPLHESFERMDEEDENSSLSSESSAKKSPVDSESSRTPNMRRKASRHSEERSPTGRSSIGRASIIPDLVSVIEEDSISSDSLAPLDQVPLEHFVLLPGKKYRRSLLVIKNVEDVSDTDRRKGRRYSTAVEEVLRLQTSQCQAQVETPVQLIRKRISLRRSSWVKQITPPPRRRLTLLPKTPDPSSVTLETPPSLRLPLRLTTRSHLGDRTLPRPPVQDNDPSCLESGRDKLLKVCNQSCIASFNDILPQESYDDCCKLGEGVYGEVFSIKRKDRKTVLKIIPVEGSERINDAYQKTYQEMAPELVIAKQLHDLRFGASNGANKASGFAEIVGVKLVQGCYPTQLLDCWDDFDEVKGSENDRPLCDSSQQYVIIEQGNGGTALEDYVFQSANTALSVFKQIVFSLAVAESAYSFEHRDLHWGNVLISRTTERKLSYFMNSREVSIAANGVKGTIIDYTLSRMDTEQGPIFNDLSKDPELFLGSGDLQFDVYRHMKKDVNNDWSQFKPKTNARWLSYILDKLLKKKYSRKTAKAHKDSMKVLIEIQSWIEKCNSALEVAAKLVEM